MQTVEELVRICRAHIESGESQQVLSLLTPSLLQQHKSHILYGIRGNALYNLHLFAEGMQFADMALALNENDTAAYRLKALISLSQKDWDNAEANLTKVIGYLPGFIPAYMERSFTYAMQDQREPASADFNAVLKLGFSFEQACLAMGELFYRHDHFKTAMDCYLQVMKNKDYHPQIFFQIAECYLGMENNEAALEAFNNLFDFREMYPRYYFSRARLLLRLQKFNESLADIQIFLEGHSGHSDALLINARALYELNRHEEAILIFNQLGAFAESRPEIYYWHADAHAACGRPEEAIKLLNAYISHDPESYEAHYKIAGLYEDTDKLPAAKDHYSRAILLAPEKPDPWLGRATICRRLSLPKEARADIETALKLAPENYYCYIALEELEESLHHWKGAIRNIHLALDYCPDTDSVNRQILLGRLGLGYWMTKQYNTALEYLDKAIAADEKDITVYSYRSRVYQSLKDYEKSLNDLNTAISLNPGNAHIYFDRSVFHNNRKNLVQALADVDTAISLRPDFAQLYCHRSVLYNKLNETDKAFTDLQTAIRLNPQLPDPWDWLSRFPETFLHSRNLLPPMNCIYRCAYLNAIQMPPPPGQQTIGLGDFPRNFFAGTLDFNVPMITSQLLPNLDYDDFEDGIPKLKKCFEATRNFRKQFQAWNILREHPGISYLAEAVMQYYFNNPPATLIILDGRIPELNCMGHTYRILAAADCGEPTEGYLAAAVSAARETTGKGSRTERYYAAYILDLAGETNEALHQLADLGTEGYLPAALRMAEIIARNTPGEYDGRIVDALSQSPMLPEKFLYLFKTEPPVRISGEEALVLDEIIDLVHVMENFQFATYVMSLPGFAANSHTSTGNEYFFSRRFRFMQFEDNQQKHFFRIRKTKAYEIAFGMEIEKKELEQDMNNYAFRGADAFMRLGDDIHKDVNASYHNKQQNYTSPRQTNFNKYILLISNLMEQGIFTERQAHLLHQYTYFCLGVYAEIVVDELVKLALDELKGKLITIESITVVGFSTLVNIGKYISQKRFGKENPVMEFTRFLDEIAEMEKEADARKLYAEEHGEN